MPPASKSEAAHANHGNPNGGGANSSFDRWTFANCRSSFFPRHGFYIRAHQQKFRTKAWVLVFRPISAPLMHPTVALGMLIFLS